jgi:DNA processing protein
MKENFFEIALSLLPGVGHVLSRNLVSYCGSAEAVFKSKKNQLEKIPGIGPKLAESVLNKDIFDRVDEELNFIAKYNIKPLYYLNQSYPKRLRNCIDAPVVLYYKGNADLNQSKIISIVGTRKATEYGKQFCVQLINDLTRHDVLVVSGLAYGIDVCIHKQCLKNHIQTVGVLGHGLDRIYPSGHRLHAEKMIECGGLLTEYMSGTNPDRENFPSRNRIVAGISDATIVVEANESGGALITAEIANSYNRDVFAVPGRTSDEFSQGCHKLIKNNKAVMLTSAADLELYMGWNRPDVKPPLQKQLPVDLSEDEKKIIELLMENSYGIDELAIKTNFNMSKLASLLLTIEMNGYIKVLPGKKYILNM